MALTVSFLGQATGVNVTSLNITTSGNSPAGGQIFVGVCLNLDGFDDIVDSVGNLYVDQTGAQVDTDTSQLGVFMFRSFNNIRLPNNGTITLTNTTNGRPVTARIAAYYITGLTSGQVEGTSGGEGNSTSPLVALDNVPAGNYLVTIVGTSAPSTNTFTQDPNFSTPGAFNTQTTPGFSVYAGYRQASTTGLVVYRPTLATPAPWVALMISLSP